MAMISASPMVGIPGSAVEMAARLERIAETLRKEVARLGGLRASNEADRQLTLLREELKAMGQLISETRAEVCGLMPTTMSHSHLTSASDELDAVVSATERAAVEIMGAAERSQEAAQRLRAMPLDPAALRELDAIESATTDIFVSCSFQDLTGQRIRKVVQALSYIERRVVSLSALWQDAGLDPSEAPKADTRADAHLLNGPSASGLAQDDIDALLNGHAKEGEPGPASQDDIDALFA